MTTDTAAGRVAVVAGRGVLPATLARALDAPLVAALDGFAPDGVVPDMTFRIERLVPFLDHLLDSGITRVVFAGAVHRPQLDPEAFDPRTATLVPRLVAAMQGGDDQTLRAIVALFEEWGLGVVGAADLVPDLCPGAGVLGVVAPGAADEADAVRADDIVAALGAVDVGQGAVVARGLCLAVETLPGTDAMLAFVAQVKAARPEAAGLRGVFWKAPKPGQDLRIDMPAIGPGTVRMAAAAGLSGIAFRAGGVMVLDRAATVAAADAAGLSLWAR